MRSLLALLVAVAASLVHVGPARAADWNKPHPHKGVLQPFSSKAPPPAIQLGPQEKQSLAQGKPVFRQSEQGDGGRGMAVFVVDAAPEVVWSVISDFPKYPAWIPEIKEAKVYGKQGPADGTQTIDVYFKLSKMGVGVDYFIRHVYHHDQRWGTWTLDYGKESDLDDSVGFWRVTPVPGQPGKSMVEYSVDLKIKGWVPGFIKDALLDNGLKQATRWVKVQSEARAKQLAGR